MADSVDASRSAEHLDATIIDLGAAREESEAEADPVGTLHKALVEQNVRLIQRLDMVGRRPSHTLFIQCAVEALIDYLFKDDPEELAVFHLASDTLVNEKLLLVLKECGG